MTVSGGNPARRQIDDLAFQLNQDANRLAGRLAPAVAASIGDLVRSMNCYYSNLIEGHDTQATVIVFLRKPRQGGAPALVACNLTPVPREHYRVGVPAAGHWQEILNTDAREFGGSGWGNLGGVDTTPQASHGHAQSVALTLPPLSTLVLRLDAHGQA